ncbi:MAG: hypothetical protein QM755_23655 [Luteolibacter sp.]
MKLPACIFTYAGGALIIPYTVRLARCAGMIPIVCEDAAAPLPGNVRGWLASEGVELIATTFPRRGNLNGTDCAAGICRTLAATARRHGTTHAMKLDDDTVVVDARVFTRHRHARAVGLTWPGGRPGAYGMAYMLRADVAEKAAARLERGTFRPTAPEDITVWETVARCGPVIERRFRARRGPFSALPLGAPIDRRFDVLNMGTPPPGGWRNRPVQMVTEMKRVFPALVD